MESEFQGWEFMALSGQLDVQTLQGYLSGTVNDEKITIMGSANLAQEGEMKLTIKTPSDNYKNVDVSLSYDIRRRSMEMEMSSATSAFHLSLKLNKPEGLEMHLLVPNSQMDTEVSMNLGVYSGQITMTSRFQRLRNFHHEYQVAIGSVITVHSNTKLNDQEIFNLDTTIDTEKKEENLEVRANRMGYRTTVYYQRQAYSSMTFIFRRQSDSTDKQFRIDVTGSGDLPSEGLLDIAVNNSFRRSPVIRTGRIQISNITGGKDITIEISPRQGKLYKFDVQYSYSDKIGDFSLRTTTPRKINSPWKNISGRWNLQDLQQAYMEISIGESTYTAQGILSLYDSNLTLNLGPTAENVLLQWKLLRDENEYLMKIGQESNYGMIRLKGVFHDIAHVDMEGSFKAGPYMDDEFVFTAKWNMDGNGILTSEGTFNYGQYNGRYHLEEFIRNAATRSATFAWIGTSNIPDFSSLSLRGNYDFNGKIVVYGLIKINDQESKIDINLADLNPEYSHNTVELNISGLPATYRAMQFTLSHDLRDPASKSFSAIAKIGEREYYAKAFWNRSEQFDQLNANIEMKTILLGDIHFLMNYDVSSIDDAHVEAKYSRISPSNEQKFVNVNWIWKRTNDNLQSELTMDSTFNILSHLKVYGNADFSNDFQLSSGIEWNEKRMTLVFLMTGDGISATLTTPFERFESIEARSTYSLGGKTKKITLEYTRGNNKVNMEFTLNAKSRKKGNMAFDLTTPFEVLKHLNIVANWKNKSAQVSIKRNDTLYNIDGTVDFKMNKSSFDLIFTIPEWQTIRMAASYDVQNFLAGTGTDKQRLASLQLEFEGKTISFNLQGFRNPNELHLEVDGNSSFEILRVLHIKLDLKLSNELTESDFEMVLNDFEFKTTNRYEKRGNNGYYMRTRIETTLTPLPALIIGIGRDGAERMVTVGYGADQEITFSIQGKNDYKDGFFGTFDIPNFGYEGVRYDVSYGFDSEDELHIRVNADLGQDGEKVEAELAYNSQGVRARLTSPFSGQQNMRFRREVSGDGVLVETSYNDYSLILRGGFKEGDTIRGALLEADVFGNKFLFDLLFQSEGLQYSEGKMIIETPFRGMEKIGGLFTLSNVDKKIEAHAEVLLPSQATPKVIAKVNLDLNDKLDGVITLDVGEEKFSLLINLAGTSLSEGYQGKIDLQTPFLALKSLLADVSIKMVGWTSLEVTGAVNDNKVTAAFTMVESVFKFDIDTLLNSVHRQFSIEAKYPSLDALQGSVIVVTGEDSHKILGTLNIVSNGIQGELDLESTLIDGPRQLKYEIYIPNVSLDQMSFKLTLITTETYSIFFEHDRTADLVTIIQLDTPILPKFTANLQVGAAHASLSVETPSGVHKAEVSWRMTFQLPADYLVSLALESYLLPHSYVANVLLTGDTTNMTFKAELQAGSEKHMIEANVLMAETSGQLSVNLETPLRNINQLALSASLSFGEKIELHINATHADSVNTFDVTYDKVNRSFIALANSPLIPTGQANAEAAIAGDMSPNMQLKLALNYGEHIISGLLDIKMLSPDNMSTILKVTTPFIGYEEMNFVARYLKDEVTNIMLSLDRPIRFSVELHLGNTDDKIMAELTMETPVPSFERVHTKVDIPLNVFGPSVSVDLDIDGASYGGNLGLRTKAPYELALGYHAPDMFSGKFHLRIDSSFLTILS